MQTSLGFVQTSLGFVHLIKSQGKLHSEKEVVSLRNSSKPKPLKNVQVSETLHQDRSQEYLIARTV